MRGGERWCFITADYVFGQTLERDIAALVQKAGGKLPGDAKYPFPDTSKCVT